MPRSRVRVPLSPPIITGPFHCVTKKCCGWGHVTILLSAAAQRVKQSRDAHCSSTQCQHGIVFVFRCRCMHYDVPSWVIADALRQTQHTPSGIGADGPRRLGLDQNEFLRTSGYDEIDFRSALVAEKVKLTAATQVRLLLDYLGGDKSLEDSSRERRAAQCDDQSIPCVPRSTDFCECRALPGRSCGRRRPVIRRTPQAAVAAIPRGDHP